MNIKDLIQSKPGKELLAAVSTVDDMKMPMAKFLQSQCHARHRSHKCGIHHGAARQIHDKFAIAAIQHFARELLEVAAIEETTFSFHFHPYGRPSYPNLNRRVHSCSSKRYQPQRRAVKPGSAWESLLSTTSECSGPSTPWVRIPGAKREPRLERRRRAAAASYSQRNERFSATIRPLAISRHRHAITRPSSK